MAINNYYNLITSYKSTIINDILTIFRVYGNELLLRLEELNLLNDDNNVIETSTALGFVIEEFVVCKLQIFYRGKKDFHFCRPNVSSTTRSSYDCFIKDNNLLTMINIKAEKVGSSNNAVAAINALHNDYCVSNNELTKCYLVLKIYYKCGRKQNLETNPKKIIISSVDGYFLEEINLSNCKHDHRNWSPVYKAISGRLLISKSNLKNDKLPPEQISFQNTKDQINSIFNKCITESK